MAKQFSSIILTLTLKAYRLHPCSLLMSRSIKTRFEYFYSCTTQATRNYCTSLISNNDDSDNQKLDKKCKNLYENADASLVNTISNILSIEEDKALQICNNFHEIKQLSKNDIINIITIVKAAGISVSMIQSNISLFVQNMEVLNDKIYCIKHLDNDINEMLPLLNIDLKYLSILVLDEVNTSNKVTKNKIRYLSERLGCSVHTLCELIINEPSIVAISFNRIKQIMDLLEEFNYDRGDILNNLWLFKYSPRTIRRRSATVASAGVNLVKSWVVRCSINLLQRYIYFLKREAKLSTLYGSHINLLCKKLNITEAEVEFYIKMCPDILEIQLDKLDEVLNILLKYGYKAEDIFLCPRVFLLKTSILEERLKRLQSIRGSHRLTLLYCSTKSFENAFKIASELYNKTNIGNQ